MAYWCIKNTARICDGCQSCYKEPDEEEKNLDELRQIIEETAENVCDNFCKYRDTADENGECDYMRENEGKCPLDEIVSY